MFYLLINRFLYATFIPYINTPDGCQTPKYNSVWTYIEFNIVLDSGLTKWIKAVCRPTYSRIEIKLYKTGNDVSDDWIVTSRKDVSDD